MYDDMLIPTGGSDGVQAAIDEGLVLADYTAGRSRTPRHRQPRLRHSPGCTVPDAKWIGLRDALETTGETAVGAIAEQAEVAGVATATVIEEVLPETRSSRMPPMRTSTRS